MDDFDQYCNWSRRPNDFIKQYRAREMGSYEILDADDNVNNEDQLSIDTKSYCDEENLGSCRSFKSNLNITECEKSLYRVRSFKRTHKGYINAGDRIKSTSSLSLNISYRNHSIPQEKSSPYTNNKNVHICSLSSPEESTINKLGNIDELDTYEEDRFTIQVIGSENVGKSSLCEQVLTSECVNLYDIDSDEESIWKVTVDLDEKEWNLIFKDTTDMTLTEIISKPPDALLIMYSIENKTSFEWCSTFLHDNFDKLSTVALFIVGNKSDLERLRQLPTERGKRLAEIYDGEFSEVSIILNHMVDNLLVQLITKVRSHKRKLRRKGTTIKNLMRQPKKSSPAEFFVNIFRKISRAL